MGSQRLFMQIQSPLENNKSFIQSFFIFFLSILALVSANAKLHAAEYFQQFMKYEIDVELVPDLGRLEGKEKLVYFNYSEDSLQHLYFHLYLNKFRSGSYAFPFSRMSSGYIDITALQNESGEELTYEIDNTILRLDLDKPIPPGDSLVLLFEFISVLPLSQSRFGYTGDHFDVGNWYPVPAVYDRFGWHADQHIDGEFYQEWGNYNVNITIPKGFVVGASGILLNPEALPDSVEFAERRIGYYDPQNVDSATVTYQFLAENVHDFAWSAEPEFVLLQRQVNNTNLNFLLMTYRMDEWEKIIDECVEGFRFLNEQIGAYPYVQLTIVDGYITAGGIEYPNIVMINDFIIDRRQLAITVIHEMAHQWFYGMLANYQTRYGWMDEGFATFFEILTAEHIWGKGDNFYLEREGFWQKLFGYRMDERSHSYLNYLEYALSGLEEPVNTAFDEFQNDPYTPSYDKPSVMLFTLKHMIGDSLFEQAIQNYFEEWKFRHPYPQDLFRSIEAITDMELSWFWDEWLNRTWNCDYRLKEISSKWKGRDLDSSFYNTYLLLQRMQPMSLPVDLRLTLKNGEVKDYRVPVEGWLRGESKENDLQPWHIANKNYLVHLKLPDKISKAEIDPDHSLPDINIFNNDNRFLPQVKLHWFHRQYLEPYPDAYTAALFPSIFYNTPDGIKIGVREKGNYIYPKYQTSAEILFSAKKGWPSADLTWKSPLSGSSTDYLYSVRGYYLAGRTGGEIAAGKEAHRSLSYKIGWQFSRLTEREYLLMPWSSGNVSNIFLSAKKEKTYRDNPYSWDFIAKGRSSTFGSDFDFQQVELSWTNFFDFDYDKKVVMQFGAGFSFGDIPLQNYFYLAQASPLKQFDHPYARAKGTLPVELIRKGHFMVPGGGDIRSSLETPVSVESIGENLLSGKLRAYIPSPFQLSPVRLPILSRLEWSLFSNWAQVWDSKIYSDQFAGEAGFSITYNYLPIWIRYFHIAKIHLDFPVWLNKPAPGYEQWDYRWTLRIDTADLL